MLQLWNRISLSAVLTVVGAVGIAHADTSGKVNVPLPSSPHEVSSELCGTCHKEIYEEWSGSMHAQSTALKDPIHGAFYRKVIGDPTEEGVRKKGKLPVCLNCHVPNAAKAKKTKLDAKPAFNEGVNCVFCHTITGFKGTDGPNGKLQMGIAAYEISDTHLQAPSGKTYSTSPVPENATPITPPFHPFPKQGANSPLHKTNDLCMGCHDRRNNFHGVPLCATGTEIADSKSFIACQSCHMPTTNGHANHSMLGGHGGGWLSGRRTKETRPRTGFGDGFAHQDAVRWSAGRSNAGVDGCDLAIELAEKAFHAACTPHRS